VERHATIWQGMEQDQSTDSRFVVFSDPKWGIRAIGKIMLDYYRKHGCNTVRRIIDRWAPPSENNSGSYVNHVAEMIGAGDDSVIDVTDADILEHITKAIIEHENGRVIYDDATIVSSIDLALE
jgi:hypothetical protein